MDFDTSVFSPAYDADVFWTGVGSRDIDLEGMTLLVEVSAFLRHLGWIGRTGGAEGADSAVESVHIGPKRLDREHMHSYLPWDGFNQRTAACGWIDTATLPTWDAAREMAARIHPVWKRELDNPGNTQIYCLSQAAKRMHTRNVFQVLGDDLLTPAKVFICWAPPQGKGVKGGTNTAYQLALAEGIPILNLYREADQDIIRDVMDSDPTFNRGEDKDNAFQIAQDAGFCGGLDDWLSSMTRRTL